MNTLFNTLKICGLGAVCFGLGTSLPPVLESFRRPGFYSDHPVHRWVTILIHVAVICYFVRKARQVYRHRRDPHRPYEAAGVKFTPMGQEFQTNAFVRLSVYIGLYLFGMVFGLTS